MDIISVPSLLTSEANPLSASLRISSGFRLTPDAISRTLSSTLFPSLCPGRSILISESEEKSKPDTTESIPASSSCSAYAGNANTSSSANTKIT